MVTLDGDLIESSGAITGGFYKKREGADISGYENEKKRIESDMETLGKDVIALNKEMEILAAKEKKTRTIGIERDKAKIDESLKKVREKRKDAYERRLILEQEINKLNIQKARLEAKFDNLKDQIEQKLHIGKKNEEKAQYYAKSEAKKTIFLIGKYQFDTINKTVTDLKEEEKKEEAQKEAAKDAGAPDAEAPPPDSLDND